MLFLVSFRDWLTMRTWGNQADGSGPEWKPSRAGGKRAETLRHLRSRLYSRALCIYSAQEKEALGFVAYTAPCIPFCLKYRCSIFFTPCLFFGGHDSHSKSVCLQRQYYD